MPCTSKRLTEVSEQILHFPVLNMLDALIWNPWKSVAVKEFRSNPKAIKMNQFLVFIHVKIFYTRNSLDYWEDLYKSPMKTKQAMSHLPEDLPTIWLWKEDFRSINS